MVYCTERSQITATSGLISYKTAQSLLVQSNFAGFYSQTLIDFPRLITFMLQNLQKYNWCQKHQKVNCKVNDDFGARGNFENAVENFTVRGQNTALCWKDH